MFCFFFSQSFSNQDYRISQSVLVLGQIALVAVLLCVLKSSVFLKYSTWISIVVWILLLLISNVYFHFPHRSRTTDDVAVIFFVIFMCHVMLPLSKLLSLCFGGLSVAIQITTSGILSPRDHFFTEVILEVIRYLYRGSGLLYCTERRVTVEIIYGRDFEYRESTRRRVSKLLVVILCLNKT